MHNINDEWDCAQLYAALTTFTDEECPKEPKVCVYNVGTVTANNTFRVRVEDALSNEAPVSP